MVLKFVVMFFGNFRWLMCVFMLKFFELWMFLIFWVWLIFGWFILILWFCGVFLCFVRRLFVCLMCCSSVVVLVLSFFGMCFLLVMKMSFGRELINGVWLMMLFIVCVDFMRVVVLFLSVLVWLLVGVVMELLRVFGFMLLGCFRWLLLFYNLILILLLDINWLMCFWIWFYEFFFI